MKNRLLSAVFLLTLFAPIPAFSSETDVAFLKKLVEINSGSQNFDGVREVQKLVEAELTQLGFSTSYIPNPMGASQSASLLVGILKGKRQDRYITLITHADTVFEPDSGFLHFSDDGKVLKGPGVGDDKAGIVIALSALKQFLAHQKELPFSIRFVNSASEEASSVGFETIFKSMGADSVMALGFEDSLADGSIAEGRNGIAKYEIHVKGKEAHSGSNHQDGANACVELSMKLVALSKLTDYKKGITVNAGYMTGGTGKFNIVCGSADAKLEIRFKNIADMNATKEKAEKILKTTLIVSDNGHIPTMTEYKEDGGKIPFSMNEKTKPFIGKYLEIVSRIESHKIFSKHLGGVADINYMANPNLIAIDDLGPIGGAAHTKDEHILKSSIETRAKAFNEFLSWAIQKI